MKTMQWGRSEILGLMNDPTVLDISSFAVLAVSDLRLHVIARDQSDRSPVWPYESRYFCLLSIEKNFKHEIYVGNKGK